MIRKAEERDLRLILPLYDAARTFMRSKGNPNQWPEGYPASNTIMADISRGDYYVIEEKGEIIAGFAFIIGIDPTYEKIEGEWLNSEPYGTVHRLVSLGKRKGIADECFSFCRSLFCNIRVDTHENNFPMIKAIRRNGFVYCGQIRVADGSLRLAYQKNK